MRLSIFSMICVALIACATYVRNSAVSITSHLFSIVPRFTVAAPFAFRVEPRSIFDTRRMGLA